MKAAEAGSIYYKHNSVTDPSYLSGIGRGITTTCTIAPGTPRKIQTLVRYLSGIGQDTATICIDGSRNTRETQPQSGRWSLGGAEQDPCLEPLPITYPLAVSFLIPS